MFGVDSSELGVIAVLALVFIGPKDLPRVMRSAGRWAGRTRSLTRQFKSGVRSVIREAELEELRRRIAEDPTLPPPATSASEADGAG